MYERWAVHALGATGGVLILWGLFTLPAPVALLIAGTLLSGAAVLLHLRSSPPPHSQPQPPPAIAALLALMRRGVPGEDEPAGEIDWGRDEAPEGGEPPGADPAQPTGTQGGEGKVAVAQAQEASGAGGAPRHRGRPFRPGRWAVVKATATTYQEGGETATHRVRVRISGGGRRSP
ncbi:hypothetical protein J2Z79_003008 [Symbiobacterium terraclitae]|uniref:Uncharacterized protein n=1 Tax=Symbiobacterium terraclitae TaxID=557451 RepID=A0ABS4JX58_9FIRM|nr:hypothetical protein [Symbiobacterium terraclitae]MBP2019566.1 hypothetical protein [Symbiobacterium terraclitae]